LNVLPFDSADTTSIGLILSILSTELLEKQVSCIQLTVCHSRQSGSFSIFPFQHYTTTTVRSNSIDQAHI